MTQLILDVNGNAISLPESQKGGYTAYEEDLSVYLTMIPGNMTKEVRGTVWHISYQYGFLEEETKKRFISSCMKGKNEPIICSFLPPDSENLIVSKFFVTNFSKPKFMWSSNGKPMWADFSVELREEVPHD